jgi:hypothetical protein
MRRLGSKRQRQVGVAAARGVIVNADTIKPCILTASDERSEVGQGPADWNAKRDADTGHSASFFNCAPWLAGKA